MGEKDIRLLCNFWCARLSRRDEPCAHPHRAGAEHQTCSDPAAIVDASCSNELHRLIRQWRRVVLDDIRTCGDQDTCRGVSRVAPCLAALCADDIRAGLACLVCVLRVTDHVHVQNAVGVEFVNYVFWRDADGGDEELRATFDDDVDEFIQTAFSIV